MKLYIGSLIILLSLISCKGKLDVFTKNNTSANSASMALNYDKSLFLIEGSKIYIQTNNLIPTLSPSVAGLSGFVISGSLPAGLAFNTTNGNITGTPTSIYDSSVTITAKDASNNSYSGTLAFKVYENINYSYVGIAEIISCYKPSATNSVKCSGRGTWGGIGDGNNIDTSTPTSIKTSGVLSGKTIKKIAVGSYQTLLMTSDNQVSGWGWSNDGALGLGVASNPNEATLIDTSGALSGKTVIDFSVGYGTSLFLTSDKRVVSSGFNDSGQVCNGNTTDQLSPVDISNMGSLSGRIPDQINAGYKNSVILTTDKKLHSCGNNSLGQLGDGTTTNRNIPTLVDLSSLDVDEYPVSIISSNSEHNFFKTNKGSYYGFGQNDSGQLGDGTFISRSTPVKLILSGLASGKTIKKISLGLHHTIILTSDNIVYTIGRGDLGQLGDGLAVSSSSWRALDFSLSGTKTPIDVIAGNNENCFKALEDNKWYCWGFNFYGQIGDGTTSQKNSPTQAFGGESI